MSLSPWHSPLAMTYKKTPAVISLQTVACDENNRPTELMADHAWKKIIDGGRGLGITYRPFLFHDPLLDKRMANIIRYIKQDPTAKVDIVTHGKHLHRSISQQLLDSNINSITIHIPCSTATTHGEQKKHQKLLNNVSDFLNLKKSKQCPVITRIECTNSQIHPNEFSTIAGQWKSNPPHSLSLMKTKIFPWQYGEQHVHKPCLNIFDEISFFADGTATLCNLDTHGRQLIGDIRENNVLEIWNGAERQHCRQILDQGERHRLPLCRGCSQHATVDFPAADSYTPQHTATLVKAHALEI